MHSHDKQFYITQKLHEQCYQGVYNKFPQERDFWYVYLHLVKPLQFSSKAHTIGTDVVIIDWLYISRQE